MVTFCSLFVGSAFTTFFTLSLHDALPIFVSNSGLLSIAGGKLTGYRKMGESIVDMVAEQLEKEHGLKFKKVSTKHLPISGGEVGGSKGFVKFSEDRVRLGVSRGLSPEAARKLVQRYGSNVDQVFNFLFTGNEEAAKEGIDPIAFAMLR